VIRINANIESAFFEAFIFDLLDESADACRSFDSITSGLFSFRFAFAAFAELDEVESTACVVLIASLSIFAAFVLFDLLISCVY
jgi:hypothetical protein